jgi:hypothetical protein
MSTTEPCLKCGSPVNLNEARHIHKVTGYWEVDGKGRPKKLISRIEAVGGAYHWWCWRADQGFGEQQSMF